MHPDENELQAFAMGSLDGPRRQSLEVHLDACASCLSVVGACEVTPTPTPPPPPPPLTRRLGPFEVHELIGHGAMGGVYRAVDLRLGREVALKLLRDTHAATTERLLTEARAQARVTHPHVVTLFEAGVHDGQVTLVMQLVRGTTLRVWQAGRPWRDVLSAYLQVGRGLAAAHACGVVHHDFKPDNVMVDATGVARVTDFGLASTAGGHVVGGTPAYLAPEACEGVADARSDQFSFCVALREALTGSRTGPLTALAPGLRAALQRGLSRDPGLRFAELTELLDALERGARFSPAWGRIGLAATALLASAALVGVEAHAPQVTPAERAVTVRARALAVDLALGAAAADASAALERHACADAELREMEQVVELVEADASLSTGAVRWLGRRAALVSCEPGASSAAVPAAVLRAEVLLLQHHEGAALAAATQAVALASSSSRARALLVQGLALGANGKPDDAVRVLRQAERAAQQRGDAPVRVRAQLAQIMELCRGLADHRRCGEALRRAQDGAVSPPEAIRLELLELEAAYVGGQGLVEKALPLFEAVCPQWAALPAFEAEWQRCRTSLMLTAEALGQQRRAVAVAAEVTSLARRDGPSVALYRALALEASVRLGAGEGEVAAPLLAEARALEPLVTVPSTLLARVRAVDAASSRRAGQLEFALALQRQVVADAGEGNPGWKLKQTLTLARWLVEADRTAEARVLLASLVASRPGWQVVPDTEAHLVGQAAMMLAALDGRWAEAARVSNWTLDLMRARGVSSRYLLPFLGARAEALFHAGQRVEAAAAVDEMEARFAKLDGATLELVAAGRLVGAQLTARASRARAVAHVGTLLAALDAEGYEGIVARDARLALSRWRR